MGTVMLGPMGPVALPDPCLFPPPGKWAMCRRRELSFGLGFIAAWTATPSRRHHYSHQRTSQAQWLSGDHGGSLCYRNVLCSRGWDRDGMKDGTRERRVGCPDGARVSHRLLKSSEPSSVPALDPALLPFLKLPFAGEPREQSFPVNCVALASVNDNAFSVGD